MTVKLKIPSPRTAALLILWLISFSFSLDAGTFRNITLKEEHLSISLKSGPEMKVVADFYFTGRELSGMVLAFPEDDRTYYRDFQAAMILSGSPVNIPVTRKAAPPDHYFDFRVAAYPVLYRIDIPENIRSFHHRVSYNARLPLYFADGSKGERPEGYLVHYILKTGSTWKGDVDLLNVEVDPGPFRCKDLTPTVQSVRGSCSDDGKWHYRSRSIELNKDVELVLKVKARSR